MKILVTGSAGFIGSADTHTDVTDLAEQFHYNPATTLEVGIQRFVTWYRN